MTLVDCRYPRDILHCRKAWAIKRVDSCAASYSAVVAGVLFFCAGLMFVLVVEDVRILIESTEGRFRIL